MYNFHQEWYLKLHSHSSYALSYYQIHLSTTSISSSSKFSKPQHSNNTQYLPSPFTPTPPPPNRTSLNSSLLPLVLANLSKIFPHFWMSTVRHRASWPSTCAPSTFGPPNVRVHTFSKSIRGLVPGGSIHLQRELSQRGYLLADDDGFMCFGFVSYFFDGFRRCFRAFFWSCAVKSDLEWSLCYGQCIDCSINIWWWKFNLNFFNMCLYYSLVYN